MASEDNKPFGVRGKVYWANLDRPNKMSSKYQFELWGLSEGAKLALESEGINVKTDPEKGHGVVYKSKNPILAFDTNGTPIETQIGNGSSARVTTHTFDWDFNGKQGTSLSCRRLVIEDLVSYVGDIDEDELVVF